ncbi:MAG: hypothetical protein GY950_36380 [bacterium]|nr:hypothetical protein [bacterium]
MQQAAGLMISCGTAASHFGRETCRGEKENLTEKGKHINIDHGDEH